ncbi:sensor histidine kinase [Sphingomonas sp. 8AM]|uniref:sensor histidine kinase n=1 Tax=Sphingomonas sp. 8AM TaxID=2653170 RepID=UPI0012F248E6|nr:ATP-binding protein [Sphingomonas sp. 8AM]VXC89680.1 Histidine kinase [Sphingomonas sp. 8AM]
MADLPAATPINRSLARRMTALMAFGFLALVLVGYAAVRVMQRNELHTGLVEHTYQVERAVLDVRRLVEESEAARRGTMLIPTRDVTRANFLRARAQLPAALARIEALTRDNPAQRRYLQGLRLQLGSLLARQDRTLTLLDQGDQRGAILSFANDAEVRDVVTIRNVLDRMARIERRLMTHRDAELRASQRAFYTLIGFGGVVLAVVAVISTLTILSYTRDLARSDEALRELNAGLEDMVAARTEDLTRANEEIQRFAYIVSHDLRSPLVNVMGFTAELETAAASLRALVERVDAEAPAVASEEARLAATEDLPEAIGFIRTSTQKMDRLINAILQLSRQGRRALAPEKIDVAALIRQIGDTLSHRLSETDTVLSVEGTLPVVVSDRLALDQIFSNLIENAVKYLRPGVPGRITVTGRRGRDRVFYTISDNGRGIDPRDHQRVFDLFRRSGAQDRPGEGIGLATVRALVFRLGGSIDVASELGQGAAFTVSLPLVIAKQELNP